jgi:hypothetical protein
LAKARRSWTSKSRLEMVQVNLKQQLGVVEKFYPNYERGILLLKETIKSFGSVERPKAFGWSLSGEEKDELRICFV